MKLGGGMVRAPVRTLASRPALEHWITPHELEALREALGRGGLPPDLLGKLGRMSGGDLSHRFIEKNCRLFAALLLAAEEGAFRDASQAQRERLLRVLAYVRRDEDALPDYRADGFTDDQREILAATVELGALLQTFKAWRLRQQVPWMWADQEVKRLHV